MVLPFVSGEHYPKNYDELWIRIFQMIVALQVKGGCTRSNMPTGLHRVD